MADLKPTQVEPTRFEGDFSGVHYIISLTKDGWIVHRHPVDRPRIPPVTGVMTVNGFESVMKSPSDLKYYDTYEQAWDEVRGVQ